MPWMARSITSMLSRNHSCARCSSAARLRSVTSTTVAINSSSSPDAVNTGCAMARRCFSGSAGRNDSELPFDACRFADCPLERLGPPRPVFRVNALPELFERGDPLLRIKAVQARVFVGGVDYLSGHAVQGGGAGMRQPLRLGKVGLASPQLGCPLGHRGLKHVPGPAKLLFCPRALVDQGGVLKGRRGVFAASPSRSWSVAVGKPMRLLVAITTPPSALTPIGMAIPRHGPRPPSTSGMISIPENPPLSAR